jgi:gas vesicle protein
MAKKAKKMGSNGHRGGSRKQLAKTLGVFALGAAAGSAVALLTAPASGKVTRKRIGMKFRSVKNAAGKQIKGAKKLLSQKALVLRREAAEKIGKSREWLVDRMATNGNGKHARKLAAHS